MLKSSSPTTIVIFGASGDLTRRKLIPALYHLCHKQRLPENLKIVGVSRRPYSYDEFRQKMLDGVQEFAEDVYTTDSWDPRCMHPSLPIEASWVWPLKKMFGDGL